MFNSVNDLVQVDMMNVNGNTLVEDSSFLGSNSAEVEGNDDVSSVCSSLSHSYSAEWERLFCCPNYLKNLRAGGMDGKLRSSRFRSVCWKLFLEVLPADQSLWSHKTKEWRNRYEELKNQLIVNPRKAEAKDLSINNPLSQEVESPWNQFFLDNELRLTIKQDVVRTFPDMMFFRENLIREIMVNILFCYARLHPLVSYRQGMHELLAPVIFVLHCDQQAFLHACELKSVSHFDQCQRNLTCEILNHEFLEHDAYAMFYQIMETVEPWYVSKEVPLGIKGNSIMKVQPFSRMQDQSSSNVIVTKLTRIQEYLLKRFDVELYEYLRKMDIPPQIYGIRWIRLLFGREFAMQELLMLWDAIFADGISFDLVDYMFVAMLTYLREAMLSSDYPSCLYLLMKYPPLVDVQHFIDKAVYLREPHERPKPPDLHFQKPKNFGTDSWENSFPLQGASGRHTLTRKTTTKGRRPGSLIIGKNTSVISKSTSEPMNLITDISPAEELPEHGKRKLSTASLSQIENSLNHQMAHGVLRSNLSTQSLARLEMASIRSEGSYSHLEQMSLASSDGGNISPKTGKYFILGNRTGRKGSGKQKAQIKTTEHEIMKVLSLLSDTDNMCRRCAVELDQHIGAIQRCLFRREQVVDDDEILLALAGIKQVRDVLKGSLKPSSTFGSPEHIPPAETEEYSRYKRQLSSNSTQSSQSATPLHDKNSGKFYLATPDLLSSDTDINSPERLFAERNPMERNPSNDTIIASGHSRSESACDGLIESRDESSSACMADPVVQDSQVMKGKKLQHIVNTDPNDIGIFQPAAELWNLQKDNKSTPSLDSSTELSVSRVVQKPSRSTPSGAGAMAIMPGRSYDSNCNVPTSGQQQQEEQRIKQDHSKDARRRDGSPIDRLADMFKNFTKF